MNQKRMINHCWMFYQVMLRGVLVQKTHFVYKKGLMDSDI